MLLSRIGCVLFFFNDTATTEIYTLSLHDALPILQVPHHGTPDVAQLLDRPAARDRAHLPVDLLERGRGESRGGAPPPDRKSTRLNSSHSQNSYAVFCLKKKKTQSARSPRPVWTRP